MTYSFFVNAMKDEMLYSLLARYREALALTGSQELGKQCFGRGVKIAATSPPNVAMFAKAVYGSACDAEKIVLEHTAYPYIASFVEAHERTRLLQSYLHAGRGQGKRQGLTGTTPHESLLFCPLCVAEDVAKCGQAAWRRVHQLPGVAVCPWHDILLRSSSVPSMGNTLLTCPIAPDAGSPVTFGSVGPAARRVATLSLELLEAMKPATESAALALGVGRLITLDGWEGAPGTIRLEFADHVVDVLGPDHAFWGGGDPARLASRIRATWRTDGHAKMGIAPVYYVAVLAVLDRTLAELRDAAAGRPLTARGSSCGTVVMERRRNEVHAAAVARHKDAILEDRASRPNDTRAEIQGRLFQSVYFLRKHEPEWLKSNLPAPLERADWPIEDERLAAEVAQAAFRLLAVPGPPRRLSVVRLVEEVRRRTPLPKHRSSLPLTEAALARHVESRKEIALRRLKWAARACVREGRVPSLEKFREEVWWVKELNAVVRRLLQLIAAAVASDDPVVFFENAIAADDVIRTTCP